MSKVLTLKPVNRHLAIVPHFKQEKADSGVLLPDDFKQEESRFIKATVIDVAPDCKEDFRSLHYSSVGAKEIVVDKSMIEEVEIGGKTHYMVLENYVVGIYRRPNES
jgi:co-chaperonin GroES (HSP10)